MLISDSLCFILINQRLQSSEKSAKKKLSQNKSKKIPAFCHWGNCACDDWDSDTINNWNEHVKDQREGQITLKNLKPELLDDFT